MEHGIEPTTIIKGIRDINERLRAVAESTVVYASERNGDFSDADKAKVEALVGTDGGRDEGGRQAARVRARRGPARRDPADPAARPRAGRLDHRRTRGRARRTRGIGRSRTDRRGGPCARSSLGGRDRSRRARRWRSPASTVLPADEEPVEHPRRRARRRRHRRWTRSPTGCPGSATSTRTTAGWQARWLDRPTWDRTVTPNIRKRTGQRSPRRR